MTKRTFWVLIETDEGILENPEKPAYSDIQEILRNRREYGIVDFLDEEDVADIVLKSDK